MNISVVIPVYNSEQILPTLVRRLEPVLRSLSSVYELVLVNDGSADASWNAIEDLASRHDWICGINLMRNYGQHNALLCGIRAARYDVIVTMDDDLQNPPEEIPKMIQKLEEGYDVVYGTPMKEQHGLLRDLASQVTKMALKTAMGVETARMVSAFRVFRSTIKDAFVNYQGSFVSIDVLLTWGTTRFAAIPVKHEVRQFDTSNYTFKKLITHAFNMMTGFSTLPLQLASILGFFVTAFGIIIFIYVVASYLIYGGSVPGFSFLACIIIIFSGTQLLVLGIFGEYLARIHFRSMDRPSSVIHEMIRNTTEGQPEQK